MRIPVIGAPNATRTKSMRILASVSIAHCQALPCLPTPGIPCGHGSVHLDSPSNFPNGFFRPLEDALADVRTTNYLVAASATVIIFDHIITIEQEVALIWRRPWNITSLLYIWNRYYALISLVIYSSYIFRIMDSNKACLRSVTFQGLSGTVLVATVDTILAFRVWILYEKSRKLLWFLIALISAEFIAMTTLTVMIVSPISSFLHLGPLLVGCWPAISASPLFLYYSSPTMITSFIMFVMTLYRCL
ncbi:hypothetical protein BD779DRAFT_1792136, partial [Infundibulicybe gibba]